VLNNCQIEGNLADTQPGDRFQFERQGYFCADIESTPGHLVFNLAVALRDTWAKIEKKGK
jgi:glutaminyl-tRNA synthetase